jgi:hypothetical protein
MSKGHTVLIRFGAVALAGAATVAGASAAAGAATSGGTPATSSGGSATTTTLPTTLAGIKSVASSEITKRVDSLNTAVAKVKKVKRLGSGRAALETYLGQDITPLQQLDTKIQNDSSVQQATADYGTIFTNFRVYLLVLPAAHVAAVASRMTNGAVPAFQAVAKKAQQHSTAANQATLSALVANLNTEITTATNATNGLASTVLGYTPAQFNADTSVLTGPQASVKQAAAAVKQGRSDVRQLRQALKPGSVPHAGPHHGSKGGSKSTTSTSS